MCRYVPFGDVLLFCYNRLSFLITLAAHLFQPAFYEAFGLTVVEAMTCGLPTFATCHGGPAEIIEHGISGFHIDPYHPNQTAELLADFFQRCKEDPSYWTKISEGGLKRIYERFVSSNLLVYVHSLTYHQCGAHAKISKL